MRKLPKFRIQGAKHRVPTSRSWSPASAARLRSEVWPKRRSNTLSKERPRTSIAMLTQCVIHWAQQHSCWHNKYIRWPLVDIKFMKMLYCTSTVCKKVQHERQWTWVTLMDSTKLRNKINMLRLSLPPKQYIYIFTFFHLVGQTSCYLNFFSPGHGLHVQLQGAQVADADVVNGSSEGFQHRGQRHRGAWRWGLGVVGPVGAMMHFRVASGQAHASGPILGITRFSEFGFSSAKWCNDIAPKSQQQT